MLELEGIEGAGRNDYGLPCDDSNQRGLLFH